MKKLEFTEGERETDAKLEGGGRFSVVSVVCSFIFMGVHAATSFFAVGETYSFSTAQLGFQSL